MSEKTSSDIGFTFSGFERWKGFFIDVPSLEDEQNETEPGLTRQFLIKANERQLISVVYKHSAVSHAEEFEFISMPEAEADDSENYPGSGSYFAFPKMSINLKSEAFRDCKFRVRINYCKPDSLAKVWLYIQKWAGPSKGQHNLSDTFEQESLNVLNKIGQALCDQCAVILNGKRLQNEIDIVNYGGSHKSIAELVGARTSEQLQNVFADQESGEDAERLYLHLFNSASGRHCNSLDDYRSLDTGVPSVMFSHAQKKNMPETVAGLYAQGASDVSDVVKFSGIVYSDEPNTLHAPAKGIALRYTLML